MIFMFDNNLGYDIYGTSRETLLTISTMVNLYPWQQMTSKSKIPTVAIASKKIVHICIVICVT